MAKAKSTKNPFWLHAASGRYCLTRKGRRYYLAPTKSEAKARYTKFKERIDRGLPIPEYGTDLEHDELPTVRLVINRFLTEQERRVASKELAQRSFNDYHRTCREIGAFVGLDTWVDDLSPDDFSRYRADVAKRRNIVGVGNEVTRVKTVFKWAADNDVIDKPVKFGTNFRRPAKKDVRKHRYRNGAKLFTPEEILLLTDELGIHYRAMVFLGINCGFGNKECSDLRLKDVDFDESTLVSIREKTGEIRFATLWPETIAALRLSLERRPKPRTKAAKDRFLVTYAGDVFIKDGQQESDIIGQRVTHTLQRLKLHERGKSFYWLRHTFRTIADQVGDDIAVKWVMGHCDDRIDRTYIHNAPVERIRKVTDHVRSWLFGGAK